MAKQENDSRTIDWVGEPRKRGRKPAGDRPMTSAERQRSSRAKIIDADMAEVSKSALLALLARPAGTHRQAEALVELGRRLGFAVAVS